MMQPAKPKTLFITTYDPKRQDLGGASWVDRQLIRKLELNADVTVLAVTAGHGVHGNIPLEIRTTNSGTALTILRMLTRKEPYQEAKFRWHPGWKDTVREVTRLAASHQTIVTSQWPALLAAESAGVTPDTHFAHNIDTVLAEVFDPTLFRLLGNADRMAIRERRLLGLPREVMALSTQDVARLKDWGVFAQHVSLVPSPAPAPANVAAGSRRAIGFIGKMAWPPNRMAVDLLLSSILPAVNGDRNLPVRVVLAGRGSELHASELVTALGVVDSVEDFYSQVDSVVIPRTGEVTGVSVKMLEALQYGKTVIAPQQLLDDAGVVKGYISADNAEAMVAAVKGFYGSQAMATSLEQDGGGDAGGRADTDRWVLSAAQSKHASEHSEDFHDVIERSLSRLVPDLPTLLSTTLEPLGPVRVQTINLHHLYLAKQLPDFLRAVRAATFVTADGWPVARMYGALGGNASRVTGSDFLREILLDARFRGKRLGLIGASEKAGEKFSAIVKQAGANLVFRDHGLKREWDPTTLEKAASENDVDILLVAVTPPYGDLLAEAIRAAGFAGVVIGVGGGVDMLVGDKVRAPRVIQKLRMEWCFRLLQDPKHLWRRYVREGIPFYIFTMLPLMRKFDRERTHA